MTKVLNCTFHLNFLIQKNVFVDILRLPSLSLDR